MVARRRLQEGGLVDAQLLHLADPILILDQRLSELGDRFHGDLPADPELLCHLLDRVHLTHLPGDLHRRPLGQRRPRRHLVRLFREGLGSAVRV